MTLEFGTTQLDSQPIVGIRTTIPMNEIGKVMGPLFGEVYGYIQQSGQTPAGMPLAIYHSTPGETVDLECAMPVASPIAGSGRVQAGELPAGTAATVTHLGPYDDLGQTWAALTEWDEVAGPRRRGRTLGGLRHRPRRRARPVEVAHGYLLPGSLIRRTSSTESNAG